MTSGNVVSLFTSVASRAADVEVILKHGLCHFCMYNFGIQSIVALVDVIVFL